MIDYLVTNWIDYFPSVTHLIPASAVKITKWNKLAFIPNVSGLVRQTGWIELYTYLTQEVSLSLFYPNCYPFRNAGEVISLVVCSARVLHKFR